MLHNGTFPIHTMTERVQEMETDIPNQHNKCGNEENESITGEAYYFDSFVNINEHDEGIIKSLETHIMCRSWKNNCKADAKTI